MPTDTLICTSCGGRINRVPAVVLPNKGRLQSLKRMLIENGQRRDLTPLDEAQAIKALMAEGLTQNQIAQHIGRSNAWVSTRMRLLSLPPEQQALINTKRMTLTEAEVITASQTRSQRKRVGHKVDPERGWSPKHFTADHPQAAEARRRCMGAGHTQRSRRIGGGACGPCWEEALRADERLAEQRD
jgi:ParB family chromosome partitioning protein